MRSALHSLKQHDNYNRYTYLHMPKESREVSKVLNKANNPCLERATYVTYARDNDTATNQSREAMYKCMRRKTLD